MRSQPSTAKPPRRGPSIVRGPKVGTSSKFRGVTKHSTTGRFEAHLWDSSSIRPKTVRHRPCCCTSRVMCV